MKEIIIDGNVYVEKSKAITGNRCVVVIDRGWIYAGDVVRENGKLILSRVVMVARFSEVWFSGLLDNPLSENVELKKINNIISVPEHSELFSVHVDDNWGL